MHRPIGAVAVLAATVAAALGAAYAGATSSRADRWLQSAVEGTLPSSRFVALLIDLIGAPPVAATLVALLAALCLVLGRRRLAIVAVTGPGCTIIATTILLKPVIGRTIHGGHLAYPSGHTALATALTLILALLAVDLIRAGPPTGVPLILAAVVTAGGGMAWSQITLGAHYPTDTLGGFCTALTVVPATAWAVDRIADRGPKTVGSPGR